MIEILNKKRRVDTSEDEESIPDIFADPSLSSTSLFMPPCPQAQKRQFIFVRIERRNFDTADEEFELHSFLTSSSYTSKLLLPATAKPLSPTPPSPKTLDPNA